MESRRLSIAVGAALVVAALGLDPSAIAPSLRGSWFFTAERIASLRWSLGGIGVVLACAPWLARFLEREEREACAGAGADRRGRIVELAFVVALALSALALEWRVGPVTTDTKFYLGEALDIAERGGVGDWLRRCFDGTWEEDNRHPLVLLALALRADRSNAMLGWAKLVSFAGAALTLVVCLRASRRRGGEAAALACGALLVTNATFVEHAVVPACESWWTAFAALALDLATRRDVERSCLRWLAVGACAALAFLTKGTGVLLTACIALWVVVAEGRRAWRSLVPAAAAFAVTALPLLVRNSLRFADPLYNVNSRRVFWLDRWEQFYDADAMQHAGARAWFAEHGLSDALRRMVGGLLKQAVHAIESLASLEPGGGLSAAVGAIVLSALVLGWRRMRDARERRLIGLVVAAWIASFAWYASVASDRRYLAVLVPLATPAIVPWTARLGEQELARLRRIVAAVVGATLALALLRAVPAARPLSFEPAPENEELHRWLRAHAERERDDVYLLGPSSSLGFDWDRALLVTRAPRPSDDRELDRLLAEPQGAHVRYLVVETDEARPRAGSSWFARDPTGALTPSNVPDHWHVAASFPATSPRVAVLERD